MTANTDVRQLADEALDSLETLQGIWEMCENREQIIAKNVERLRALCAALSAPDPATPSPRDRAPPLKTDIYIQIGRLEAIAEEMEEWGDNPNCVEVIKEAADTLKAFAALQPLEASGTAESPEQYDWVGCGECDVSFPCHHGEKRCLRLDPQALDEGTIRDAALEEAAKVCEDMATQFPSYQGIHGVLREAAAAIRQLQEG